MRDAICLAAMAALGFGVCWFAVRGSAVSVVFLFGFLLFSNLSVRAANVGAAHDD